MLAIDRLKLINLSFPCKSIWAKALLLISLVIRWLKPAAIEEFNCWSLKHMEPSFAGGFSRCAFNCRRLHLSELELQLQLPEASADVRSIAGGFSLRIED